MNVCGPYLSSQGIFSGPPRVNPSSRSVYVGIGEAAPWNEHGRASHPEFPNSPFTPPVYRDPSRGRLLPKARGCANADAAPLITLPLMMSGISGGSVSTPAFGCDASAAAAGFY